ncbi:TonB-dependent receptor [Shewanella sp. C32]|uniref:TonB-dependent receptor n=1 Tax=Shewanella electrica TaxID=515560 RepID=A0ABT2FLG9_9GAMM|nr:TonB-dependent receptor [Shewanella electrica]MCH1925522.1 TonB-dependent receptor [Shewanella electrica]MCS4557171.1 TonB-dependent receptor [Shewanella electrica]
MFKQTTLASAIFLALSSQAVYAAENDVAQQSEPSTQQQQADDMEVIQVVGIRSSLNKSVNLKRQNVQVVDAIVAEDIGKFPDNNVVEALQRVTGVQVTDRSSGEVNTVSIRGLTDVTTTVNGRKMFTAAGQQVAVADIPASLLESVEVFKTRSASQLASGLAGQIDIRTHRPFNFEGAKVVVNARGVYSDQADKTDPALSALLSNRWDTSIGEVGALINVSYTRANYRDQNVTAGAVVPFFAGDNPQDYGFDNQYQFIKDGWNKGLENGLPYQMNGEEFPTFDLAGGPSDVPYMLSRDAIFQNDLHGERERPALNLSLQWAPNDTSEYLFETFYNGYRNKTFNSLLFAHADGWWDNDPENIHFYPGTNVVKDRIVGSPAVWSSGDYSESSTDSYVFALGGKWDISSELQLKSEIVYQTSKYKTDFIGMRGSASGIPNLTVDFNHGGGIPSWAITNDDGSRVDLSQVPWNYNAYYDNGGEDEGDSISWTLDGDYYVDWGIFTKAKFGVRYENRGATSKTRGVDNGPFANHNAEALPEEIVYRNPYFFDNEGDVPTTWVVPDSRKVFNNRGTYRDFFGIPADEVVLRKTFDITEKTYEAYVQSDYETELLGKRIDGQIGVRYTRTDNDLTFLRYESPLPNETNVVTAIDSGDSSNDKFLPNFIARLWLTDDLVARFAYTQTLRQPEFGQLNPNIVWNKNLTDPTRNGNARGGNPDLQPVKSKNYDLSLEYYFGNGSSVYGTWFRRDIDGFTADTLSFVEDHIEPGETEAYDYILSRPGNTSNGKLEGYEIGAVYFPEGLPNWLDGLGTQVSGTILDSSQDIPQFNTETGELIGYVTRDMYGVSDKSFSAVLIYDKEVFSARLSYVWRDDFLLTDGEPIFANPRGIYRKPEKSLDLSVSYDVTDDLVVTFDATNITNELYQEYYKDSTIFNTGTSLYSRTFSLGVRYSF